MNFMTLASYAPRDGWNAYTYECESGTCDAAVARTVVEVPIALDEFALRKIARPAAQHLPLFFVVILYADNGSDPIAVRTCAPEFDSQSMVPVSTIVAKEQCRTAIGGDQ